MLDGMADGDRSYVSFAYRCVCGRGRVTFAGGGGSPRPVLLQRGTARDSAGVPSSSVFGRRRPASRNGAGVRPPVQAAHHRRQRSAENIARFLITAPAITMSAASSSLLSDRVIHLSKLPKSLPVKRRASCISNFQNVHRHVSVCDFFHALHFFFRFTCFFFHFDRLLIILFPLFIVNFFYTPELVTMIQLVKYPYFKI